MIMMVLVQIKCQAGMCGVGLDVGGGGALEWGQLAGAGPRCSASLKGPPPHDHVGA